MPGSVPTPLAYSPIVDEAVIQDSMRGSWDQTISIIAILDYLKARGKMKGVKSGKYVEMRARVGRRSKTQRGDLVARSFARHNDRVTYSWPWSMHEITDLISNNDVMFLRGNDDSVREDLLATRLTEMSEDFRNGLWSDIMRKNGGTNTVFGQTIHSGSDVPFYGLPTVFQYGSSASAYNPSTQVVGGAIAATDKEAAPANSYAGVTLGPVTAISGINGKVNESTSPVLVNWSSTAWDGSSATWLANCTKALSHLHTRLTRDGGSESDRPDCGFMDESHYTTFKQKLRSETNLQVVVQEVPTSPDTGMHPRIYINYEGVKYHLDRMTPANVVYCLNTRKIEYDYFIQDDLGENQRGPLKGKVEQMFHVEAQKDIDVGGWKYVVGQACQLKINPKYQGALYNFA